MTGPGHVPNNRLLRAALALMVAGILGLLLIRDFKPSADLRVFLPSAQSDEEQLLLDGIAEGPGSRLLFLVIDGADADTLVAQSKSLAEALGRQASIRLVSNGDIGLSSIPEAWINARWLLTDRYDTAPLDAATLHDALLEREADLASASGGLLEDWLARDPTLEMQHVLERRAHGVGPETRFDVWFDPSGKQALLLVEPHATAFDTAENRAVITMIQTEFERIAHGTDARLSVVGPGAHGVRIEAHIRNEANQLGLLATFGVLGLIGLLYRRWRFLWLAALPLAGAAIAGITAVALVFGTVHGVTLAFGFTLIGVAQDYPLHLLSHLKQGTTPTTTVRRLWPTLLTGVASTSIACLAFWWSGVDGLKQLALFTITGLWTAAAVTRFVLPDWVGTATPLPAHRWLDAAMSPGSRFALWRGILVLLAAGTALWLVIGPGIRFENDLARLSPLPKAWLDRDIELRRAFGSPDMRHVLYVDAVTADQALVALEALDDELELLVGQGAIEGFDHLARWIPAESTQRARQVQLPRPDAARDMLDRAMVDTAFVADAFDPFLDDLEAARTMAPVRPSDLEGTPLALKCDSLLVPKGDDVAALITLRGHIDPVQLAAFAANTPGVHAVDLKAASERMVARYRDRIIDSLLMAGLLLAAVIVVSLRSIRRTIRVLLPMILSIVMVLGVLTAMGVPLSLFHLIALILAAGLGIDYALFFEAAAHEANADPHAARHALVACAVSTLLVFGLLATSSLPVLRALGTTVSLGVVFNFMFAQFLLQSLPTRGSPPT